MTKLVQSLSILAFATLYFASPFAFSQATAGTAKELPRNANNTNKRGTAVTRKISSDPLVVHGAALVIDTHADTTQRFLDESWSLGDPLKGGNLNLDSAKNGNLGAEFFSIWVNPEPSRDSMCTAHFR